jgi:hypothetical protein
MNANVLILVREKGRLVDYREGHNVWVVQGREYLAKVITLASFDPDVPIDERGVKHIAFGIGGHKQSLPAIADSPPMSLAYPAGYDPHATNGHAYRADYPINPLIQTLERPVRISGSSQPYTPAPIGDIWFTQPPPPGLIRTFTPSTPANTTEGTVDLVGAFPGSLDGKTLVLKAANDGSQLYFAPEQTVVFSSPVDAAAVKSQIEAQAAGINAMLGPANGLVLFTDSAGAIGKLQIVGGTALADLGLVAERVLGVTPGEVIFRAVIDATAGDIVGLGAPYGPFTAGVPLSEVGLFLSGLDVTTDFYVPGHLVAYHTFDTILLTPSHELELFWLVRF